MSNVISIIIALFFAWIVYFGISQKGFLVGYVLNFLYCFANLYLQNGGPEITVIVVAGVFLTAAIITAVEYMAYQKTQSFLGYLAYVVLIVVVIMAIVFLTKTLFTFLADPSVLFNQ